MLLLQKKSIHINQQGYEHLVEKIKVLGRVMNLKKDNHFSYQPNYSPKKGDSDTDERFVATAFWISMFSDKSPVIVTQDTDFVYLLGTTSRLFGSSQFQPNNSHFRNSLYVNPVRLYIGSNGNYHEKINTRGTIYTDKLEIHSIPESEEKNISKGISIFWKDFAKNLPTLKQSQSSYTTYKGQAHLEVSSTPQQA